MRALVRAAHGVVYSTTIRDHETSFSGRWAEESPSLDNRLSCSGAAHSTRCLLARA